MLPKKQCSHLYGKSYADVDKVEQECNRQGCTYISNNDCNRNDGFQICTPNTRLIETSNTRRCVYQRGN